MNSQASSKYDMRLNPVYQVDWQNAASGKRVSATKRRVLWRFGFSNAEAISQGLTGVNCRGEEHEVSVVWSLTSGKRLVMADGQEVHFSFGKRTDSKFETSWTMSGGHILKMIAHAAPPLFETPGFKQFDLLLDGCSYFDMPKIFELGTPKANKLALARVPRSPAAAYNNYSVPISPTYERESYGYSQQEEYYGEQTPVRHSAPTAVRQRAPTVNRQPNFATPSKQSAPIDMISAPTSPSHVADYFDAPASFASQVQVDEFTPVPPQPPTFQAVSNQILSAYVPTANTVPALANESHTYMQQQRQQQTQQPAYHQTYNQALVAVSRDNSESIVAFDRPSSPQVITPTMAPMSIEDLESRDRPPMSEMEKALKSLVNLEDISETVVTPEQRKAVQKKMQNKSHKSKPLPPTAPEWHLGNKAALGDIKKHSPPKAPLVKDIMRIHAFDPAAAAAGMLVVYGATIPQSQGFGAGVHMSHYGYHPQQQQQQQQQMMYAAY
jgi:hypothetical protein